MKKLFLFGAAICALWACNSTVDGYKVNVKVSGDVAQLKSDTIILTNNAEGEDLITATAVLSNGVAVLEGAAINTPQNVMIVVKDGDKSQRVAMLFLENGVSDVNVNFVEGGRPEVKIKGGSYQTVADSLGAIQNELFKANNMEELMKNYRTADKDEQERIAQLYDSLTAIVEKASNDYIESHPTSLYALTSLSRGLESMSIEEAEAKLASFKALSEYAANKNIAKIGEVVSVLKSLQPGKVAPDFVQSDVDGNPVKFSDVYSKNKVTMVDFWASWCGPCRAFNPTLTKIYKEYKGKGFGIIGVSLDRDKDAWIKAIKDDKLDWIHVSDLGFWNNEVAKQYHVRYIPQSIFVDQNGVIIKRQPSEEEIVELLKANL